MSTATDKFRPPKMIQIICSQNRFFWVYGHWTIIRVVLYCIEVRIRMKSPFKNFLPVSRVQGRKIFPRNLPRFASTPIQLWCNKLKKLVFCRLS
jgi:hypothetical protein